MTVLHTIASLHRDAGGPSRTVTMEFPVLGSEHAEARNMATGARECMGRPTRR